MLEKVGIRCVLLQNFKELRSIVRTNVQQAGKPKGSICRNEGSLCSEKTPKYLSALVDIISSCSLSASCSSC
jgi:hypothetical protein